MWFREPGMERAYSVYEEAEVQKLQCKIKNTDDRSGL